MFRQLKILVAAIVLFATLPIAAQAAGTDGLRRACRHGDHHACYVLHHPPHHHHRPHHMQPQYN